MRHILIVEDEEHLAKGIKFNLEAEGYRVTTVDNGASALELFDSESSTHQGNQERFDLVILDLMMPGMSGYAVCETLRERGADLPVLILSARTLTEDRTRGFDSGADQYLTKPFELDELLSRVKSLIARHEGRRARSESSRVASDNETASGNIARIGDAIVNLDAFEVTKDNKTQRMTALEIKLLQYLMDSDGRVVSRQELLEDVWEQPGYIQTRAPDQFIRRLRKLFEDDPSNPKRFLTIRDVGYRFVADE